MVSRIRKVKCDETKPLCSRCRHTGRQCDGYPSIKSLPLSILQNQQELRSYQYFWHRVLPFLPGHYDHVFWSSWVRRACFDEPAIQYAMIAVGALHESVALDFAKKPSMAIRQQLFSIQQYNKAIQQLSNGDSNPPATAIILTCCIIFIMYENLYGRNAEASKHLKSGIAMLKFWLPTTSSEKMVNEEYLTPIYTRGYACGTTVVPFSDARDLHGIRKALQVTLDTIYSAVDSAVLCGEAETIRQTVSNAQRSMQEWYDIFVATEQAQDLEQQRARILLRLQFETASILLAAVMIEDEVEFDEQVYRFRVIIDQCELLVANESSLLDDNTTDADVFIYGFDLNILPPLNITAFKCRDPVLRRKAIALLRAGNRYEGLWNGKTVAHIAQRTLELEEAEIVNVASCADIPREKRMRLSSLSYNLNCTDCGTR